LFDLIKSVPFRDALRGYSIDGYSPLLVLGDLIGLDMIVQHLPCSRLAPMIEYIIEKADDDELAIVVVEMVRAVLIEISNGL
jgi:hypothetical protein